MKSKSKVGGGPMGKNVRSVQLRGGKPADAMSPCAVAQQGKAVNKPAEAEPLRSGRGNSPVPLGNTLTMTNGPGKGRTVSGSGSQGSH